MDSPFRSGIPRIPSQKHEWCSPRSEWFSSNTLEAGDWRFLLMSLPHQEVRTSTWGIATLMFHYKVLRRRWVSIYNKCYTQPRKSHQLPPNVLHETSCFHCIMQGKSSPRWVTSCLTMQAILGGLCILLPLLAVSQVQRHGGFGELVA